MARIDISNCHPWDLTLVIDGAAYATLRPTWDDVIELHKVEQALQAVQVKNAQGEAPPADLEALVRGGVARFFPQAVAKAAVKSAAFDDLLVAFDVANQYFSDWLKKKRAKAIASMLEQSSVAQPAPSAPGK